MTQEEKAKAYDKVREKIAIRFGSNVADEIFSQFEMSEDERIRKEIIATIHLYYGEPLENEAKEMIAWLEKQGEQKQHLELNAEQKSPICWIKCSDELPNRDGTYLVVTDGSHNDVYDMAKYDSIDGWHKASEIIYWMPIPQLNNESIIEQKPAWSEDDEQYLEDTLNLLEGHRSKNTYGDVVDWLKSLRPQNRWKPSYEQMEAVKDAIEFLGCTKKVREDLKSLYEQLKKLREE